MKVSNFVKKSLLGALFVVLSAFVNLVLAEGDHSIAIDQAVAPTCDHVGKTEGSHCARCGEVIVRQQTIPAKGHTPVADAAIEATCTHEGKTAGSHCSVCNAIITAQQTIPAKGHDQNVIIPSVPATYSSTGLTEGRKCSVCGAVVVAQTVVPMLDAIDPKSGLGSATFTCAASGNRSAKAATSGSNVYEYSKSQTEFTNHINNLLSHGYSQLATNTIGNIYFKTLKDNKNTKIVTAYWIGNESKLRMIVEPYYNYATSIPNQYENAPDYDSRLFMMSQYDDVKNAYSEQMCMAFRLDDGRFVLYDTGNLGSVGTANGMIETLKNYSYHYKNTAAQKIRIAAIFLSHPHSDHVEGFIELAKNYKDLVSVDKVYLNIPVDERPVASWTKTKQVWVTDANKTFARINEDLVAAATALGADIQVVRTGYSVTIANAKFEVLFTPDDFGTFQLGIEGTENNTRYHDINNASLLVKATVSGQTVFLSGDCRGGEGKLFKTMYNGNSGVKCDIITSCHHGMGHPESLYLHDIANPFICMWSNTKTKVDEITSQKTYVNGARKAKYNLYPDDGEKKPNAKIHLRTDGIYSGSDKITR